MPPTARSIPPSSFLRSISGQQMGSVKSISCDILRHHRPSLPRPHHHILQGLLRHLISPMDLQHQTLPTHLACSISNGIMGISFHLSRARLTRLIRLSTDLGSVILIIIFTVHRNLYLHLHSLNISKPNRSTIQTSIILLSTSNKPIIQHLRLTAWPTIPNSLQHKGRCLLQTRCSLKEVNSQLACLPVTLSEVYVLVPSN